LFDLAFGGEPVGARSTLKKARVFLPDLALTAMIGRTLSV